MNSPERVTSDRPAVVESRRDFAAAPVAVDWRSRLTQSAAIIGLPVLVLVLTPGVLLQIGGIDPYVYTGYVHDYRQLYEFFGQTYYSNRIAAIDVGRVASALLGPVNGFYAVRYLLLLLAAASVVSIARRFYDLSTALVAAVLFCFSPWLLRAVAYNYIDGFVIAYVLAAFALMVVPRRHVVLAHAAAGGLLALAVNTNVFTLAVAGPFVPSWYLLRRPGGLRGAAVLAASVTAAFVVTYVGLAVILRAEFPDRPWFFEAATLQAVNYLMVNGQATSYFEPLSTFLARRHYYIFVPIGFCAASVIVAARTRKDMLAGGRTPYLLAASTYLVLMVLVYLLNHYGLHHARITRYYYFSYLAIPTFLAAIALVGELSRVVEPSRRTSVLVTATILYLVTYVMYSPVPSTAARIGTMLLAVWAVTAIAGPLAMFAAGQPTLRLIALLASLVAAPIPFYYSAEDYIDLHSTSRAALEWDMYRASFQLQQQIGSVIEPKTGNIRFWYNPALPDHDSLNALQSTYLWGYSRIPQMPKVDADFRQRISEGRYLVLIGLSDDEVDRGLQALTEADIEYRLLRRDRSEGKAWSCVFAILDMARATAGAPK